MTVSNDEVAAVVVKSTSFRDKFRKSIKSISHKLQILGGSRNRSRSIGDSDGLTMGPPSAATSQMNLSPQGRPKARPLGSREGSPAGTPSPGGGGSLSRRFSALAHRPDVPSPRRSSVQLAASSVEVAAPEMGSRSVSSQSGQRGFVVHRPPTTKPDALVPLAPPGPSRPSPRAMASSSSLDKLQTSFDGPTSGLPAGIPRRSSDIEVPGRQRAPSVASSSGVVSTSGLSSRLMRIISRNGSSRSRQHVATTSDHEADASTPDRIPSSGALSGSESGGRQSFESVSAGYHGHTLGIMGRPGDNRPRRGSNLSEGVTMDMRWRSESRPRNVSVQEEQVDEPLDWLGSTSDEDDDEVSSDRGHHHRSEGENPSAEHTTTNQAPIASAPPSLASIPDVSPAVESMHQARDVPGPVHRHDHVGEEVDGGLAIEIGRRPRKGSTAQRTRTSREVER